MKNTIAAMFMSFAAASAFAQGIPVSASYEAPVSASAVADDVSAPALASDAKDGRRPAPSLSDCCGVPVSAPQYANKEEDDSDSLAMAGLGFGLVSLVGVSKLARRKNQK
jgi:hypothetical protein